MWNLLLFGPAFFGAGVGDYSSSEGRVRGREEASPEFAATDKIAVQLASWKVPHLLLEQCFLKVREISSGSWLTAALLSS